MATIERTGFYRTRHWNEVREFPDSIPATGGREFLGETAEEVLDTYQFEDWQEFVRWMYETHNTRIHFAREGDPVPSELENY